MDSTLENQVLLALKKIRDPELPVNIVDLGLIYELTVLAEGKVHIVMTLTNPGCPVIDDFIRQIRHVTMQIEDVKDVVVDLTWTPPWDMSRMTDAAKIELKLI